MSEVDQLDDAGRAGTPITNEMANPPHCDRDKLVCPFARWSDAKIESDAKAIAERDTRIAQLQETNDCIPEFETKVADDAKVIADLTATIAKSCDETRYEDFDNGCPRAKAADRVIAALREALKPFAGIADLVNHTERRDGERVFELPKPKGGYWILVREDFRRALAAYEQDVGK